MWIFNLQTMLLRRDLMIPLLLKDTILMLEMPSGLLYIKLVLSDRMHGMGKAKNFDLYIFAGKAGSYLFSECSPAVTQDLGNSYIVMSRSSRNFTFQSPTFLFLTFLTFDLRRMKSERKSKEKDDDEKMRQTIEKLSVKWMYKVVVCVYTIHHHFKAYKKSSGIKFQFSEGPTQLLFVNYESSKHKTVL